MSILKGAKDPKDIIKSIMFCQTKDAAVKIYRHLIAQAACSEEYVGIFHASLKQKTKSEIQHRFQLPSSTLRCLIATIAFGMVCKFNTLNNHRHLGLS